MSIAAYTEHSTSRSVQTAQWRLHYNEAGAGHPVIMLHGTGPGATGWSNFNQNLALAAKYRVILLDFPGWGQSDELDPTQPRNPNLALAVKLLMDELGLEKAALVGNSMGGGATMQFAADYPERLSHLITMGSGIFGPPMLTAGGLSEGLRVLRETYQDPTPENFGRLVKVMVYDASYATPELMAQRSEAALANPNHLKNWLAAPLATPPAADFLGKMMRLQVPALFIHGRDDRTVHWETSLRALSVVPNSRMTLLNRCGHWAQLEHAREFEALVDNFIAFNGDSDAEKTAGFGG